MSCGVTVLDIYRLVASLVIIILGTLLVTADDCDENSLTHGCKDLKVEAGGSLTEVHNKTIVKLGALRGWIVQSAQSRYLQHWKSLH